MRRGLRQKRQRRIAILFLGAVAAAVVTMVVVWYGYQQPDVRILNHRYQCQQALCNYQVRLLNRGGPQSVQLMWHAHVVTQKPGMAIGIINKKVELVAGEVVYLKAGGERVLEGRFRKPTNTSYVVLKLLPHPSS